MNQNFNVIIKPTYECNLACRYCYLEKSCVSGKMSLETLELAIKQVMSLPNKKNIRWIWHGGEATLMGVNFFEEAVDKQKKYLNGQEVKNTIQTNATLIDDNFINFFEKNHFVISTSLDGPEEIHDLIRVYPDGSGSFKDTWAGIQLIRARNDELKKLGKNFNLGEGVACVLSKKNISKLDEIYSFFLENNLTVNITPLINAGRAIEDFNEFGIGDAEYGIALVKLFDRWFYEDDLGIEVKPLSSILNSLISNKPKVCHFEPSCRDQFISIDPHGNVYPCGRFGGIKEFVLGNIHENDLLEILNSSKHIEMKKRGVEIIDECKACEYLKLCNSGCMFNAYIRNKRSDKKDYYCSSYKILFSHIKNALDKELINAEIK